jgi:hypothetical protein
VSSRPLPRFALSKFDIGSGSGVVLGAAGRGGGFGGWGAACCGPTPTRLRAEGVRAGRGFTRGVEVQERCGMATLTAGAVRVLQARGWDHRLTDHAIITNFIHEGVCRRHTMRRTTNTCCCSNVRVKALWQCDTTCSGPRKKFPASSTRCLHAAAASLGCLPEEV